MPANDPISRSAIYQIRCLINGKVYVGSAVNFKQRWQDHRKRLSGGYHYNRKLQNAWRKHGPNQFAFEVLEIVPDPAHLLAREQAWLDRLRPSDAGRGYNIYPVAGSPFGLKHSPETRAKLAAAQEGRKHGPEARARMMAAWVRRKLDPENHARMSAAQKASPKAAANWAELGTTNKGRKPSIETRAKISTALKGRKPSAEHRANLSVALKGRKPGAACRAALAIFNRNKHHRPSPRQTSFPFMS